MRHSRRHFLKTTTLATAGGMLTFPKFAPPSERINVALIGVRNMGFGVLKHHLDNAEVRCVALCDVDRPLLEERAAEVTDKQGTSPKLFGDHRKLLEEKDLDAVIIGTPDHWHCHMTVDALQAGKDVYVEKPMANTIGECNLMVQAARASGRLVQVGQQQRSNPIFREAVQLVRNGELGELRKIDIWANFNYGLGTKIQMDQAVPAGIDYERWLGPAPERPFNPARFHGSWRHFWDYGGGMFSDWGVHLVDVALWALNDTYGPCSINCYGYNNSDSPKMRETFDTQTAVFPKNDCPVHYSMTAGIQTNGMYGDSPYGLAFVGNDATLIVNRNGYRLVPEEDDEQLRVPARERGDGKESHGAHVRNFLDCIKSREQPNCPPEAGRDAAVHVHAANIAARLRQYDLTYNFKTGRFTNYGKANDFLLPDYRKGWRLPKI